MDSKGNGAMGTSVNFDDLLLEMGDPVGRYRWIVFGGLVFAIFPSFLSSINMFFTAYEPPHRCRDDPFSADWFSVNSSSPTALPALDRCSEWVNLTNPELGTRPCQHGHEYQLDPKEWFVTNEFDLVCEHRYFLSLGLTLQYVGVMIGNFLFGPLADLFGRRKSLLLASFLHTFLGVVLLFVRGPILYFACAFFQGIFLQGMLLSSVTSSSELFHPKQRTFQGIVIMFPWPFAIFFLAFLYSQMGNWRYVLGFITSASALVTVYAWFLPESLRWLMIRGKTEEAMALIQRFAKFNKKSIKSSMESDVTELAKKMATAEKHSTKTLLASLFGSSTIRKYSIVLAMAWFSSMLSFISISYNIPMLGGNVYVSYMITGMTLCLANSVSFFIFNRFGRRLPLFIVFIVGSVSVLISALIRYLGLGDGLSSEVPAIAFAIVGVLNMSVCVGGLMIYTAEIYPTFMRSVGLSFTGCFARIGSFVSPQLLLLANVWQPLPMMICSGFGLVSGALILLLPETNKKSLPDSVKDVSRLRKDRQTEMMTVT